MLSQSLFYVLVRLNENKKNSKGVLSNRQGNRVFTKRAVVMGKREWEEGDEVEDDEKVKFVRKKVASNKNVLSSRVA